MVRDMDLARKILLAIEEQYVDVALYNLKIEGYDTKQIAYHCDMLYKEELLEDYKAMYADDTLYSFGVSGLTWKGHEYLDSIRDDKVWDKTKTIIKKKGLPMIFGTIKEVATDVIAAMLKNVITGL